MTAPVETDRSPLDTLKAALAGGALNKAAQEAGERLVKRLTSPVRVAILGMPETGKSTIFNMLAGQIVLPPGVALPTTQLVYGDEPRMVCTLSDASEKIFDGIALEDAVALQPALIKLEMPIRQLKKISLLEVRAGADEVAQQRAARWASKRADMALWCTTEFSDTELNIWASVPESLQHHSFLVLNKADILTRQGVLTDRIEALQDHVEDYFHSLVPLAARQALASMHDNSEQSAELFASSGGQALITSILREVREGRRADMDNVDVFLHRHALTQQEPDPQPEAAEPAPIAVEPEPIVEEPVEEPASVEPVMQDDPAPDERPAELDHPEMSEFAAALEMVKSGLEQNTESLDAFEPDGELTEMPDFDALGEYKSPSREEMSKDVDARVAALKYMSESAVDLTKIIEDKPDDNAQAVLGQCVQIVDHLGDIVLNDTRADAALDGYDRRCQEASELLVLMQLETESVNALDGVLVLLQLKREFEERVAA